MRLFGLVACLQNELQIGALSAGERSAGGLNTLSFGDTVVSTSEWSKLNYKTNFVIKIFSRFTKIYTFVVKTCTYVNMTLNS